MQPSLNFPSEPGQSWTYASLTVIDGPRRLKPCEVAFDRLLFTEPPRLTSAQVEIIVRNGDLEHRTLARVLAHDAEATRIPIQLLPSR